MSDASQDIYATSPPFTRRFTDGNPLERHRHPHPTDYGRRTTTGSLPTAEEVEVSAPLPNIVVTARRNDGSTMQRRGTRRGTLLFDPAAFPKTHTLQTPELQPLIPSSETVEEQTPPFRSYLWTTFQRLLFLAGGPIVAYIVFLFAEGSEHAERFFIERIQRPWHLITLPLTWMALSFLIQTFFRGASGSGIPQSMVAIKKVSDLDVQNQAAQLLEDSGLEVQVMTEDDKPVPNTKIFPPRPKTLRQWLNGEPLLRGYASLNIVVGKIFGTIASQAIGLPVGREGPSVQIGLSIFYLISLLGHFGVAETKAALLAGAGAGVGSAFFTPLGGILFGLGELSSTTGGLEHRLIPAAVCIAGIITRGLIGPYELYFGRVRSVYLDGDKVDDSFFLILMLLAFFAGIMGGLYCKIAVKICTFLENSSSQFATRHRKYPWFVPAFCGFILACFGQIFPSDAVFGNGYSLAHRLMHYTSRAGGGKGASEAIVKGLGSFKFWCLFPVKWFGMIIAIASQLPGGNFAPTLTCGLSMGAFWAVLLDRAGLPDWVGSPSTANLSLALTLSAGAAFFAGVTQASLLGFLIVFEVCGLDPSWIIPLLSSSLIATYGSQLVQEVPLMEELTLVKLQKERLMKEENERPPMTWHVSNASLGRSTPT